MGGRAAGGRPTHRVVAPVEVPASVRDAALELVPIAPTLVQPPDL
ncbi:hypothetical protein [Mycobacterium asiaticum]|nr:hypothetical protein [Mycobacterium asiaticum]